MNISRPFIRRPVGTTLLAIGLILIGAVAYRFLPVASLPSIDLPTIRVSASQPGADPATMAATVAAPLERRLGKIAGVTELTSTTTLGSTSIAIQFDLSRNVDKAARDVQAALNAAATDLPLDLPSLPTFRKANPNATPIMILALTSDTVSASAIYDAADSVIAQRLSQIDGVADVTVSGADQPAVRVRLDPGRLAAMGLSAETVRTAIANANAVSPVGILDGTDRTATLALNDQLRSPAAYGNIVVRVSADGVVVRLSDIATIEQSTRNSRSAAWFNRQPAILLNITKQVNANVIETVDRIHALLPELRRWVPAGINVSVLSDRTTTIRASVDDMQLTLMAAAILVMMVVFLFLRRGAATVAAGVTVPLSLAGTLAAMWLAGFSINNLSLMALAVSVGFVVDDAIVMIENVFRNLEKGLSPLRAAFAGAQQIGFTVVSISVSLVAAFIPLLFMGGILGALLREFSVTLIFAIAISAVVSLSVTPMVCAHFVRAAPSATATWLDRAVEAVQSAMVNVYARSLRLFLHMRVVALVVVFATLALTVALYIKTPKGFFPQDDTGLLFGFTEASTDVSFRTMVELQRRVVEVVTSDPAIAGVGSSLGASFFSTTANQGRLFISLKPLAERDGISPQRVIDRLRVRLARIAGINTFLAAIQDLRAGARSSKSQYQFTLWSDDLEELQRWVPRVVDRLGQLPGITDITTDRQQAGLQANVVIDRTAASRLGVRIQDIDSALNNAFAQRQISLIYGQRNQYRVVMEVEPQFQRDPSDIGQIYVPAAGGILVPLSAVARIERGSAPMVVNHQGQYPSVTVSYNLTSDTALEQASADIQRAVAELHMPATIRTEFAGDAKTFASGAGTQPLLILAALIAVYIVLGVLYESLAHPLTIISTLPSAGLGALLALQVSGAELTVIAVIGIILLIGIVKKNGIMLVDFALEAERRRGLSAEDAIFQACLERFRPILMTTLASLLGAVPLLIASGPGSELRRPLGLTIIGGLILSQALTLYTTPVIYLWLDKLHRRWWGGSSPSATPRGGQLTSIGLR
ncbi:acriflavine resistance protein B [Vineibacter terrae]|uniref:Acriflavine resistance protein B n=1 Tax=Vineibacter terrae TaxID=2586908 RepID=A0A5C8PN14_9HYPH|nr:efflux RND transporter permease subunit [Vineibacter terrae]TXL75190.1 acriflavine resistance protein B [Vineibacter terrae]